MPEHTRTAHGSPKATTIKLSPATRDRLKRLGHKGETYDELLLRVLKAYEMLEESP